MCMQSAKGRGAAAGAEGPSTSHICSAKLNVDVDDDHGDDCDEKKPDDFNAQWCCG